MKNSPDKLRILIDADPIRYRVGFAAQSEIREVVFENGITEEIKQVRFEPKPDKTAYMQLNDWLHDNPDWKAVEEERIVEVEEVSHVLQMLKKQMNSIINEIRDYYSKDYRDIFTHVVLSGKGNHRDEIATLKTYKGNRPKDRRPAHYDALTDYLVRNYGARIVDGREADDEVSILAHSSGDMDYVIATIDKDLDQIPGKHYDYMKKTHYTIDAHESSRFFWYQVLAGDVTDNIGGAYRIGPQRAEKILKTMEHENKEALYEQIIDYNAIAWKTVQDVYAEQGTLPGCPYKDANAAALENARLVYLQKTPGELWVPPGSKKLQITSTQLDD